LEGSKFGVVEFNKHLEEIGAPWTLRMTLWPLLTNVFALASPMPLEAPVIRTTFSFAMIISPMFTYSK